MNILPRIFAPNRRAAARPGMSGTEIAAATIALQQAAGAALAAILDMRAPVLCDLGALAVLLPGPRAKLPPLTSVAPDADMVASLLRDPASLRPRVQKGSGFGADILVPMVLRQAFADSAFRHDLGETCRRFLAERVLFHPGPPPVPRFSPGALAVMLCPVATGLPAVHAALVAATRDLVAEDGLAAFWDQWLLRMLTNAGWPVTVDADLPLLAWQGDPHATTLDGLPPDAPGCWPSVLTLVP